MSKYLLSLLMLSTLSTWAVNGQDEELPKTNILMMDMKYSNGNFTFTNLNKISATEHTYENQPQFTTDGNYILFSREVLKKKGNSQTEIYRYKMNGAKVNRLTNTPENEFSPKVYKEGNGISAIRQDEEGNQYVAKYTNEGEFVRLEKMNDEKVGYYEWLNDQNIIIYALPDPVMMKWVNIFTNEETLITSKIGHTIEFNKRDNCIYYVDNSDENAWYVKKVGINNILATPEIVVQTMPGVEDFTMLNDGSLITHNNGKLYHFAPGVMGEFDGKFQTNWRMIADLSRLDCPTMITRMAVSPENNKLVMVVSEEDPYYSMEHKKRKRN